MSPPLGGDIFYTFPLKVHKLAYKPLAYYGTGGITMSDNFQGTVRCRADDLREAMSIHTRKITDSCRDKDCIEDLRVFLTTGSQQVLDSAAGAKVRCADLLYSYIDVEPVPFDRNHYCIDVTFYYRIIADTMVSGCRPTSL